MAALGTAVRRLDVGLKFARAQMETDTRRRHRYAEGGTGEHLAVGTVAQADFVRIDFRLIPDTAAMAGTVNSHDRSLNVGTPGLQILYDRSGAWTGHGPGSAETSAIRHPGFRFASSGLRGPGLPQEPNL